MHFVCHPIVHWTLLVDVTDWLDQTIVKGTTGRVCIQESEGTGGCLVAGGFGRTRSTAARSQLLTPSSFQVEPVPRCVVL